MNKRDWIILLFIGIVSIFTLRDLYQPGFYTSHDGWNHVARLYHFNQAIKDGQIPPRWGGYLLNGFGYPLFIFSYHLPWFLAEPLVLAGISIFTSIKFVFVLTYLISGITMYLWISQMWGRKEAIISALVYLYIPYRFLNIFVRGNIGESASFAFLPLIFWGIYRASQKKYFSSIIIGSIGLAGLLLTHIMISELIFLPFVLFFLTTLFYSKEKKKFLLTSLSMFFLGIGLSFYYLLPAYFYKPLTIFGSISNNFYLNHFTTLKDLIYSPWGYSVIGHPGEMTRQVGLVILGIFFLSVGINLFLILKSKMNKEIVISSIFILSFGFAIYMMIDASKPIWKILEPLSPVDIPWRFLAITTFCGSILAGYIVKLAQPWNKLRVLVMLMIIFSSFYTNRNHLRINQATDIPLELYVLSEETTNTNAEYAPIWVDKNEARKKNNFIESNIKIQKSMKVTNQISFTYSSSSDTKTKIHHMFFPGWQAQIDGKKTNILKSEIGGMMLSLPKGDHEVKMKYQSTIPMRIGNIITLLSLLVLTILIVVNIRKKSASQSFTKIKR